SAAWRGATLALARARAGGGGILPLAPPEGCSHHVVRVRRAKRFRHHVLHAQRLEHRAHGTAGDNTRPRWRRPQVDAARAMAASHVVVQRSAFAQRHSDEAAFGGIGRLADRLRNLTGLAGAEADPSFFIADDDKRSETEATPALHHFGYAVDVNEFVGEFALALFPVAAIARFTCHDFVPSCYPLQLSSEDKYLLACPSFVLRRRSTFRN